MRLIRPSIEYKQQVLEYKNEFMENGDDIELLLSNNITTIVDLRSGDEVQCKPHS